MNARSPAVSRGFTLLEVLIAMAIAAVIALVSYQALSTASAGAEATRAVFQEVNRLDRSWQILGGDLQQALKPEPGPLGLRFEFAGSSLRATGANAQQGILMLTRRGWVNPLERLRSDMQKVIYRVEEGTLWRDYLPERNLNYDDIDFVYEAYNQRLLDGVRDIQLRFLSAAVVQSRGQAALEGYRYSDDWEPEWPSPDQQEATRTTLPLAVEITIEMEAGYSITRLFEIGR